MARLESILYEGEQDPILFVGVVEERADMTRLVELGTSKRNGSRYLLHRKSPLRISSGAPLGYKDAPSWQQCPTNTLVLVDTFVQ